MMHRPNERMVLHADLFVSSLSVALDFYCNKLGFSLVDEGVVQGPIVASLSRGKFSEARLALLRVSRSGALIELQQFQAASALTAEPATLVPERSLVTILVADLAAHIEQSKCKGLHPSSDIFAVHLPNRGSCSVIFYEDPDGNRLEFVEVAPPQRRDGLGSTT